LEEEPDQEMDDQEMDDMLKLEKNNTIFKEGMIARLDMLLY
jgi:hypothetical protein